MNEIRISLTQEDFEKLVAGDVVDKKSFDGKVVKIALQDIGFRVMLDTVWTRYKLLLKQYGL